MENTLINQRILQVLSEHDISQNKFAKDAKLEQRTINNQLRGVSTLTFPLIEAISNMFPDLSMEWLIRGTGPSSLSVRIDGLEPSRHTSSAPINDSNELAIVVDYQRSIIEDQKILIKQLQYQRSIEQKA